MPHITPLTEEDLPDYRDEFAAMAAGAGYVPNSFWTLGRRPQILDAVRTLAQAVFSGSVDPGLKSLVAVMSSYGAGCKYCQAHQAVASLHRGVTQDKLDALASFEHSPLFSDADRAALRLAFASGQQPNGATAQHFDDLRHHFDDGELVEICAVIALFGFLNRWNETVATELEDVPVTVASKHLDGLRWEPGRHRPN
ncbi:MAG: carboxymuconolactone decarboxylase family protein [Acidimicrobiales bacterium]